MVALMIGLPTLANAADITAAQEVNIATNTNVATTSFVGGAYNAAIGEINTNRSAINVLNGSDSTAGSVAKTVKDNAAGATYNANETYTAGTVGAAIKSLETTAGNAADKDLSNLSNTGKANVSALGTYDSSVNYTAGTVGAAIKSKADSATTLSGYGITDAYTKTEVDTAIEGSANTAEYDANETYTAGTVGAAIKSLESASSTTKGFAVHGTWGQPTTATGHVNVVNSSTLNP